MRAILLGFCLLTATACDEKAATGPTVPINTQFTLSPGEAARLEGTGIRIQFVRVSGDSRCPADAVCIQGGDAIVHIRIVDDATTDYELHTGDSSRATITYRSLRVTLVELQPYPFSSQPIRPEEYRARIQVRG